MNPNTNRFDLRAAVIASVYVIMLVIIISGLSSALLLYPVAVMKVIFVLAPMGIIIAFWIYFYKSLKKPELRD